MGDSNNPDVSPVGFGGTDHPRSTMARRRGKWWIALGIVLIVVGLAGIVRFVVQLTDPDVAIDGEQVARGRVAALSDAASPATFVVEAPGSYTVWLDAGDVVAGNARDVVVAAANCDAKFADGTSSTFRGAIQGVSVEFGDLATIGTFDAPVGPVEVACRSELFGSRVFRDRLAVEREFSVFTGKPSVGWTSWITFFVAVPSLILGPMAIGRGWTGTLRRRRHRSDASVSHG